MRKVQETSVRERAELIKVRKLCFNCLQPGHRSEDCDGPKCKQCGRKHHTLLHRENITTETPISKQLAEQPAPKQMTNRRTTL